MSLGKGWGKGATLPADEVGFFYFNTALEELGLTGRQRQLMLELGLMLGDNDEVKRIWRRDDRGYYCWPCTENLAVRLGAKETTVRRLLRELESKQLLQVERVTGGGHRLTVRSHRYYVADADGRPFKPARVPQGTPASVSIKEQVLARASTRRGTPGKSPGTHESSAGESHEEHATHTGHAAKHEHERGLASDVTGLHVTSVTPRDTEAPGVPSGQSRGPLGSESGVPSGQSRGPAGHPDPLSGSSQGRSSQEGSAQEREQAPSCAQPAPPFRPPARSKSRRRKRQVAPEAHWLIPDDWSPTQAQRDMIKRAGIRQAVFDAEVDHWRSARFSSAIVNIGGFLLSSGQIRKMKRRQIDERISDLERGIVWNDPRDNGLVTVESALKLEERA